MNLVETLIGAVSGNPGSVAIVEPSGGTTTFAEFREMGGRAAAGLSSAGIVAGDRVVVLVPVSAVLYATLVGLWSIGASAVLVDPSASEERVASCCGSAGARGIVLSPKAHLLLAKSPTLRGIPARLCSSGWLPGSRPLMGRVAKSRVEDLDPGSLALVTFTSGSTGEPKPTGRTHGFLLSQYAVLGRTLGLAPGQVDLATLPVFVLANLGRGVTTVVPDADLSSVGRISPAPVLRQMSRWGVTRTVASPAFLTRLLDGCDREGLVLDGLSSVHTGGAPVFPSLLRRMAAAAPNARVVAVYGSTEAEPIAEQEWGDVTDGDLAATAAGKGLLAGLPVPELEACTVSWGGLVGEPGVRELAEDEFDGLRCVAGEPGEIVVSGDHVLAGYLDPSLDAMTKVRVAGRVWHRTGDTGYLDASGRIWLLGRAGTEVRVSHASGTRVLYPFQVEAALDGFPGVSRSALVPGGDGEAVLVVQGDGGLDVLALKRWGRDLGIARVEAVREIPMDARHNAKVDYPALRRALSLRK